MKTFPFPRDISDQVRVILGVVGVYLILFGLLAFVWSVRASMGQRLYEKILTEKRTPEQELQLARQSFHLYSRNYALCIRAATTAFETAGKESNPERVEFYFTEADYWVSRGLNLNPWLMELHFMKAKLVGRTSPQAAADVWQAYVDWHFWEPRNLQLLAEFQEAAGREQEARKTRDLLGRLGDLNRSGL